MAHPSPRNRPPLAGKGHIVTCPNCGHALPKRLNDGIAFCPTCRTEVDSSSRLNRIMSAAWMVYRQNPAEIDRVAKSVGLTEPEAILVEAFMMDNVFSVEEFRFAIDSMNVR